MPVQAAALGHCADLELTFRSVAAATAVARALAIEMADVPDGARASCHAEGLRVCGQIEATDLPALRATVTSMLRLADVAARAVDLAS